MNFVSVITYQITANSLEEAHEKARNENFDCIGTIHTTNLDHESYLCHDPSHCENNIKCKNHCNAKNSRSITK